MSEESGGERPKLRKTGDVVPFKRPTKSNDAFPLLGSDDLFVFDENQMRTSADNAARRLINENSHLTGGQLSIWTVPEDSALLQNAILAWDMGQKTDGPIDQLVAYAKEYLRRREDGIL